MTKEEKFIKEAIKLAKISATEGEVPVGAVIVKGDKIIATGRNTRENTNNATAHAEMQAIENACEKLNSWRLCECELYCTLEPCAMCAGAIINTRIKKVVFGAFEPKFGSCGSVINLFDLPFNHKPEVIPGILKDECSNLMKDFFKKIREVKK